MSGVLLMQWSDVEPMVHIYILEVYVYIFFFVFIEGNSSSKVLI